MNPFGAKDVPTEKKAMEDDDLPPTQKASPQNLTNQQATGLTQKVIKIGKAGNYKGNHDDGKNLRNLSEDQ